jgi:DNA-binding XRE family transcriptional regulator
VPKPKQAGEKLEVVAGPAREKVSKGCSVCDPENEGERKYICGTCVQLSLAEGIKKKKTNRENKKRKRLPFESWMNHRQARIYGKHVLWQSYCRKCANWYFEDQDGRRDCDCCGKDVSLKEYRNKRRLTQAQLAEEWKISQPMIAQMEKGIKPIPARFQRKMSGK